MQTATIFSGNLNFQVSLPDPFSEVIPGVLWGAVEAFPTPAYWAFQVYARRLVDKSIKYKLGDTLTEEIAACLLGGHGIPAPIGVAAFKKLKQAGIFCGQPVTETELLKLLTQPIQINKRVVHYRFAKQKAKYLATALAIISTDNPPVNSGKSLRDWLINFPGIGYKTASWITRNWLDADDVAILDIHIFRAGLLGKFFDPNLKIERHYLQLENQFLEFCDGLNVRASELDALIWHEMMMSRRTVQKVMKASGIFHDKTKPSQSGSRANQRKTNSNQIALIA